MLERFPQNKFCLNSKKYKLLQFNIWERQGIIFYVFYGEKEVVFALRLYDVIKESSKVT